MEIPNKTLTRGEEEIMQILWTLGEGSVNDIIERTDAPRPKYTTVATFIKLLKNKGFVGHKPAGKSHCYFPLVDKEAYARSVLSSVVSSYFDNSPAQLISFFSRREDISIQEMEEILDAMKRLRQ